MARIDRPSLRSAGGNLLLVEGPNDKRTLRALTEAVGLKILYDIDECGGYQNLRRTLPERLRESGLKNVGIVVDSDTDVSARWQSLRDRLRECGYDNVPTAPDPNGTVIEGAIRVGVWLMPDNTLSGAIENFVRYLIPEDGIALLRYAEECVDGIPAPYQRDNENWHSKAVVHTWLAWQNEPGKPMGQAITQRMLNPVTGNVGAFVTWLGQLYEAGFSA